MGRDRVAHPATYVALGDLGDPIALLTIFGLGLHAALLARRVRGAILWGIGISALAGLGATRAFALETPLVRFSGVVGAPPSPSGTAFQLDFAGLLARPPVEVLGVLFVFLFLDLFDTIGSLYGLGRQAGLLEDGKLPRARGALAADAAGTALGACLGTSTVTSYVESAAGIAAGGRTGLTAVTCGVAFLCALFLAPLLESIGAGVVVATEPALVTRYPLVAPVLILIGALMLGALRDVRWDDVGEAIPAFPTAALMPLAFSITEWIAWGLIAASLLALVRGRRVPAAVHVLAALFVLRYLFLAE